MRNIILLEDEEILGKIYKKNLEGAGYSVIWLKTTGEVEQVIDTIHADVIILDQGIAGDDRSGLDIVPMVKAVNPKAKIIMLSNYSQFQMRQKAVEAGAMDYLVKIDTTPTKLIEYINNLFL